MSLGLGYHFDNLGVNRVSETSVRLPQKSFKSCGPFCGPSCVHSGPLAPLRASNKNPETRTIKRNQLINLIENDSPGDSRRLHHFLFCSCGFTRISPGIGHSRFESARLGCFVARQFSVGNCNTPGLVRKFFDHQFANSFSTSVCTVVSLLCL